MPWLEAELALVQPRLVIPLGRHALAHFTDDAKISEVHGTEMTERGRSLFPMYHPAAALRGAGAAGDPVRGRPQAEAGARSPAVARRARSSRRRAGW